MTANQITIHFMPVGNRTVNWTKVNQIKLSMQEYGVVGGITLIRTRLFHPRQAARYYAVDGQHRYLAAEALGKLDQLHVFIVNKDFNTIPEIVEFVSTLNAVQTPWKLIDYVTAYASVGNKEYSTLLSLSNTYAVALNLVAMILGGASRSRAAQLIKNGDFKVNDLDKSIEILKIIQDIVPIFGSSNTVPLSHFTFAFYNWYSSANYNHRRFKAYLTTNYEKLMVLGQEGVEYILARYE